MPSSPAKQPPTPPVLPPVAKSTKGPAKAKGGASHSKRAAEHSRPGEEKDETHDSSANGGREAEAGLEPGHASPSPDELPKRPLPKRSKTITPTRATVAEPADPVSAGGEEVNDVAERDAQVAVCEIHTSASVEPMTASSGRRTPAPRGSPRSGRTKSSESSPDADDREGKTHLISEEHDDKKVQAEAPHRRQAAMQQASAGKVGKKQRDDDLPVEATAVKQPRLEKAEERPRTTLQAPSEDVAVSAVMAPARASPQTALPPSSPQSPLSPVSPAPSIASPTSVTAAAGPKVVFNIAGVNVSAFLAESSDPPPMFSRANKSRRNRRKKQLTAENAVFAQHQALREDPHSYGKLFQKAPAASEEDVLRSLNEFTDSPALVYAELLWKYAPEAIASMAMMRAQRALETSAGSRLRARTGLKLEEGVPRE